MHCSGRCDARVVDEYVDAPERFACRGDQSLDVGLLADIGTYHQSASPCLANASRNLLGRRGLGARRVIDDNVGALARKSECNAATDARATAGDESYPPGESHAFSAPSTSSSIFLASPKSIRLFSLKNSGLSTPA